MEHVFCIFVIFLGISISIFVAPSCGSTVTVILHLFFGFSFFFFRFMSCEHAQQVLVQLLFLAVVTRDPNCEL